MPSWTAIFSAVVTALGAIRDFFAWKRSADDRAAGRNEAKSETLSKNAEAVRQANEAEVEGLREHAANPGDEAYDQDFIRKDGT